MMSEVKTPRAQSTNFFPMGRDVTGGWAGGAICHTVFVKNCNAAAVAAVLGITTCPPSFR